MSIVLICFSSLNLFALLCSGASVRHSAIEEEDRYHYQQKVPRGITTPTHAETYKVES